MRHPGWLRISNRMGLPIHQREGSTLHTLIAKGQIIETLDCPGLLGGVFSPLLIFFGSRGYELCKSR